MRVAIVHYWLVGMRGGEKVLEAICDLFPEADIYTHAYQPSNVSKVFSHHKVTETFIAKLPGGRTNQKMYLPLMPRALESLDLTGYDLVISSEAGPAKGVITHPDAFHVCYVHSPMRYLWDKYWVYKEQAGALQTLAMKIFAPSLRQWDVLSAARVDLFIANSSFVQRRIQKAWRRASVVVHPPVAVDSFLNETPPDDKNTAPYLFIGELVSYKRPELALRTCQTLGRPLKIIGDGPLESLLRKEASPNTQVMGRLGFDELKNEIASCRALIYPGEEDFGITPLEASASGRPVIALAKGGATETVVDRSTGILFKDGSVTGLQNAISSFESWETDFSPETARNQAAQFSVKRFQLGFSDAVVKHAPSHLREAIEERLTEVGTQRLSN